MARALILETTFLIDLERELTRGVEGPAQEVLAAQPDASCCVTFTVAGELAAGYDADQRDTWAELLAPFRVLSCNEDVCWHYGSAYRYLKDNGLLIGSNDLWIAATALAYGLPVVTRNLKHYRRVPGLSVVSYG